MEYQISSSAIAAESLEFLPDVPATTPGGWHPAGRASRWRLKGFQPHKRSSRDGYAAITGNHWSSR